MILCGNVHKLERIVLNSLVSAAVEAGDTLLAAVSGGADSTALLAALSALCGGLGGACRRFRLNALHVDHALRGNESRADAASVADLCGRLGVPCRVVTAGAGLIEEAARRNGSGIEAAARDFRHAALRGEADRLGARFILIAHTRNDMLENTLLRILRGAGPAGLAAIPERNGQILRPLITLERGEICAYLEKRGVAWREDSSNNDERYLRNRIRIRLVPLLDEHFPAWRKAVAALAETQALTAEFLKAEAESRISWEEEAGGKLSCALSRFAAESRIIREEALFLAYDHLASAERGADGNGADEPPPRALPRRATLRDFAGKIADSRTELPAQTLGGIGAGASGGRIIAAARKQKPLEECASILIDKPGLYRFKNFSIECIAVDGPACVCRFIVHGVQQTRPPQFL
ncbi:MAG: tRNA lysidine(34) synthetase TilS [Spirochaetaceae bacterium]|nr:tRNA lysidine(34) synthetase TilS [Spirochaetaceae bacterium]